MSPKCISSVHTNHILGNFHEKCLKKQEKRETDPTQGFTVYFSGIFHLRSTIREKGLKVQYVLPLLLTPIIFRNVFFLRTPERTLSKLRHSRWEIAMAA